MMNFDNCIEMNKKIKKRINKHSMNKVELVEALRLSLSLKMLRHRKER